MTSHKDRIRSIRTPPRLSSVSPSKRPPRENDGPTPLQLLRKAETIGETIVCDVPSRKVEITGGKLAQGKAEFASSSALARLYHEEHIQHPQYRAGSEYTRLRRLLFGSAVARESGLTKVMATSIDDRIREANRKAREERDDEAYADYMVEQRTLFERGEHALHHVQRPLHDRARYAHTLLSVFRNQVRILVRRVCIDDEYPRRLETSVPLLRIGLTALSDVWRMDA